jgi:hypothetical protein
VLELNSVPVHIDGIIHRRLFMRSAHTLVPLMVAAGLSLTAGCSSEPKSGDSADGEKMTVVYEATGAGRASLIRYVDVSTQRVVHMAEGAPLPWKKEATGKKTDHVTLTVSAATEKEVVSCRLMVNGKEVATETSPTIVECTMPSGQ